MFDAGEAAGAPECKWPSRPVSGGGEGAWRSGPSIASHFLAHPEARGQAPSDPGAVLDQGVLAGPTD